MKRNILSIFIRFDSVWNLAARLLQPGNSIGTSPDMKVTEKGSNNCRAIKIISPRNEEIPQLMVAGQCKRNWGNIYCNINIYGFN